MAIGCVEEYKGALVQNGMVSNVPASPPLRTQFVDFSGGEADTTNAMGPDTGLVGISTDAACYVEFAVSPTAAASTPSFYMPAGATRFFGYNPANGFKVSFVAV